MSSRLVVGVLCAGLILLFGPWTVANADDERSDFALFDGTNPVNLPPSTGAACASRRAFTYHVTVTNYGTAGGVRIRYADGDQVDYKIPADGSFSLSQAAGSKGGADRAVRVCGVNGAVLVGAMSALGDEDEELRCVSCDDPANGGVGDGGCKAIAPTPSLFTSP